MDLVPHVDHPERLVANIYNIISVSTDPSQAIMWKNGNYYIVADFPVGHIPANTPYEIPLWFVSSITSQGIMAKPKFPIPLDDISDWQKKAKQVKTLSPIQRSLRAWGRDLQRQKRHSRHGRKATAH